MKIKSIAQENLNTQNIQLEVVSWTVREPYADIDKLVARITGRLQRKYKLNVNPGIIKAKMKRYREIYTTTQDNLKRYIIPSPNGHADSQCIRKEGIKKFLTKKFPRENAKILDIIISWVVELEYLR